MKYIFSYLKKYPKLLALDGLGAVFFVAINLGLPTILARMIDEGILPKNQERLYFWALMMFILIIAGLFGRIILSYASSKLTTLMIKEMRNDLFDKIQQYSHHEYEQIGVSSLVTRVSSDAFVLMQFADMSLRMGVVAPLMMFFSMVMILITSPSLAWLLLIAVPIIGYSIYWIAVKSRPLSEKQQATLDRVNQYARENLTGLRVIRAFAREEYQEERFETQNTTYADTSKKLFKLLGLAPSLFTHVLIWIIVLIMWFALKPIEQGSLQVGNLVAFIEYAFHALFSFMLFANLFMMYPRTEIGRAHV